MRTMQLFWGLASTAQLSRLGDSPRFSHFANQVLFGQLGFSTIATIESASICGFSSVTDSAPLTCLSKHRGCCRAAANGDANGCRSFATFAERKATMPLSMVERGFDLLHFDVHLSSSGGSEFARKPVLHVAQVVLPLVADAATAELEEERVDGIAHRTDGVHPIF